MRRRKLHHADRRRKPSQCPETLGALPRACADWRPAQPVSFADTQALCKLHVTKTAIAEDLLRRVYAEANGSARRVCVNLALIESVANSSGIKEMDLATWGERELFTGEAPVRGR